MDTIPIQMKYWWLSLKNYRVRVNLRDSLDAGRVGPKNGPTLEKGITWLICT